MGGRQLFLKECLPRACILAAVHSVGELPENAEKMKECICLENS